MIEIEFRRRIRERVFSSFARGRGTINFLRVSHPPVWGPGSRKPPKSWDLKIWAPWFFHVLTVSLSILSLFTLIWKSPAKGSLVRSLVSNLNDFYRKESSITEADFFKNLVFFWKVIFWSCIFFLTFICFRGVLNLNWYMGKKVQKNFLMGLKIWWSWGSRFFFSKSP